MEGRAREMAAASSHVELFHPNQPRSIFTISEAESFPHRKNLEGRMSRINGRYPVLVLRSRQKHIIESFRHRRVSSPLTSRLFAVINSRGFRRKDFSYFSPLRVVFPTTRPDGGSPASSLPNDNKPGSRINNSNASADEKWRRFSGGRFLAGIQLFRYVVSDGEGRS